MRARSEGERWDKELAKAVSLGKYALGNILEFHLNTEGLAGGCG